MNPTSQAIKNMKYNYVGWFPFWFNQKLLHLIEAFFFYILHYLKTISHVSRQNFFSFESDFNLFPIFIFTRVFFLNLIYFYEILNNFCDNNLQIIIF